uniref:Methyltransferase domain-containing protein n=1 Tax=Panagrolaimus sp. ES5 TaxID=591445 RepID=A0AC34FRQ9_9BILA
MDKWSGATDFCSAIDNIVEIESETDFFKNKKILEVGFSTGLPTIYALEHGASSATLSEEAYETYIKPTMEQNKAVNAKIEYVIGDVDNLDDKIGSEKFDIILAPELVLTNSEYFEKIHLLLDSALANDGIIILSGRTHYHTCNGNMAYMLDLIKSKNRFIAIDRTPISLKHDTAPRKIIQLFRYFCLFCFFDLRVLNFFKFILSGRTHYHNCSGNMSLMLEMIKSKNAFVIIDRTPLSLKHDTAPRKIIQLMRMF